MPSPRAAARVPARVPRTAARPSRIASLVLLSLLALLVAACSADPGGGASRLLHYQRTWPDGKVEQQTVWSDGKVEMLHGEVRERLTLSASDLARLTDALAMPIPTGSPDDSPRRRLELADGTLIEAPTPTPGSVTELLERLLDTHALG